MKRGARIALLLSALAGVLATGSAASARVYSPRVVSPHNADAYSLKTFAQFHRWRDLQGDARAWEIYKYLVDTRTGVFHMNQVLEGHDTLSEYRTIRDPIKILNVYGYGYCAIFGPVMAGIAEGAGIGRGRMIVIPAWNHVATEAFYEGKWHYLDIDVRAVFRRDDGTLASMADAKQDASLWRERGPLFFPNDRLERARDIYEKTDVNHYFNFHFTGHTMDYVLRQGETFTRWWRPQGGRWHHAETYNKSEFLRTLFEKEPRGPKPNHRHFTVHDYGNGRFAYEPDLTIASSDFADGVYDAENVRPGRDGLTLAEPGEGYAVFEVRSPYVIVPVVGDRETTDDDREASVAKIDAAGLTASVSLDNGLTWHDLSVGPSPATIDLTSHVGGTYGYLLKLSLSGRPGEALLRSLRITTWVQVAPAALPSLRRGENRIELRTGDHHGLDTRVLEIRPNSGDPDDFLKHCVVPPEDYDPARTTSRIKGAFVVKAEAPPGTKIAWFSAGGGFRTHQHEAARNTRNSLGYAVDEPRGFTTIHQADVPTDTDHWNYNADREVRLDAPARTIYLRYFGDPAVNNIRVYLHCIENQPRPASGPLRVRHGWREDGALKTESPTLNAQGEYTITCEKDPSDEFIELAVPSDSGRGGDTR